MSEKLLMWIGFPTFLEALFLEFRCGTDIPGPVFSQENGWVVPLDSISFRFPISMEGCTVAEEGTPPI